MGNKKNKMRSLKMNELISNGKVICPSNCKYIENGECVYKEKCIVRDEMIPNIAKITGFPANPIPKKESSDGD